jgi:hypothetical protein
LQNQATEGFSVHGSRLPKLEAEVVQIQAFVQISPRYLISVGSAGFDTLRIFVPLFWATCRLFTIIPIVLDFRMFLRVNFIYSVYPCPVKTSRGSILLLWSFYTLFTLCPFETKMGSMLVFRPRLYFLIGQVIFVPEWPNGEFVSL